MPDFFAYIKTKLPDTLDYIKRNANSDLDGAQSVSSIPFRLIRPFSNFRLPSWLFRWAAVACVQRVTSLNNNIADVDRRIRNREDGTH